MAVIAGVLGAVNGIGTVRKWSISTKADVKPFVASNTLGGPGRLAGNKDWNGNYDAYGPTPEVVPGDPFAFIGQLADGSTVEGTAIVDEITVNIDIEGGNIINHTVTFSANGELASGVTAVTDVSDPAAQTSIGCDVQIADVADPVGAFTPLPDVRTVTITLRRANQAYVSSDTAGQTMRSRGNFDLSLSVTLYTDDLDDLPAPNDKSQVHVYVSATEYWDIAWVIWSDLTGIDVDIEGGANIGATLNGAFSGWENVGGSGDWQAGAVIDPALATIWPESGS